jgi:hypothetical protein
MAPGKKCLVAPQAAAFCVTVAGVAQWLRLLQIDGGGWYWLCAPSKVLTDRKNLLSFSSLVMFHHAKFLNYVITSELMSWPRKLSGRNFGANGVVL